MTGPVQLPAKYIEARRALAAAHGVDEVKDIRDKAVAMAVYARQAKDGDLIALATDIRKRAERRIGELMEQERKEGKLAKGSRGTLAGRVVKKPARDIPTLAARGVDKNLADRARKMASLPEAKFEAEVARAVKVAVAAAEDDKAVISAARAERHAAKRKQRDEREQTLAGKQLALPQKKYGAILADPEWRFESWSRDTGMDRAADNHYSTSDLEAIKARDVQSIAAADCILFLWATAPMIEAALSVMRAWGFTDKAQAVWDKEIAGTGYWFRNQHETLLVGTRGNVPAPAPGMQWSSLLRERRTEHSVKPDCVYELIESYFPNVPKIELNARKVRAGWASWGNEAPLDEAAE